MMWRKSSIASAFLALILLLAGCNSGAYSKNTQGNQLFAEGKFDEALEAYQNAQVEDPDAPQPHYNAGNVLHEQAAYSEAITETLNALNGADSTLASWVYYNVGNSAFRLGQYEQASEQAKTTLRTDPDDWDAKLNLEIAHSGWNSNKTKLATARNRVKSGRINRTNSSKISNNRTNNRTNSNRISNTGSAATGPATTGSAATGPTTTGPTTTGSAATGAAGPATGAATAGSATQPGATRYADSNADADSPDWRANTAERGNRYTNPSSRGHGTSAAAAKRR